MDKFFSLILLIILTPFFLTVSLFLLVTQGLPIFFIQKRIGLNGIHFNIIKFRTMKINSEILGTSTKKDDNRITKFGKLLRLTSIDELPQIINIIKGDMSFVGNRCGVLEDYTDLNLLTNSHFKLKPGITGLAQVKGRSSLDLKSKRNYEKFYINNVSFFLDLKILLLTPLVLFSFKKSN
jgi:undecaprenyl phosphate N,N'-diacetylbacillosamine 1-phosphate transferase